MTHGTFGKTHAAAADRYERLEYRRSGNSGLDLPALSLGLWQNFGTDRPYANQREILLHAFDLGITHFDNADRYGPPHRAAQRFLGRVLANDLAPYRDELIVSTKAGNPIGPGPYLRGGSRKSLLASLEQSQLPPERTREAAGLLRRAGVPLLIHQPRYSLFDRGPELSGLLKLAAEEQFGLIVYSPLAQGLLTNKYLDAIPASARARNSAFLSPDVIDDTYRRRAAALNQLAERRGQSLAQLALQWVLRQPQVTSALIGASSTWQLDHNVRALDFPPLTEEELTLLDEHGVHGTGLKR